MKIDFLSSYQKNKLICYECLNHHLLKSYFSLFLLQAVTANDFIA